jgi:hypothetical protein
MDATVCRFCRRSELSGMHVVEAYELRERRMCGVDVYTV